MSPSETITYGYDELDRLTDVCYVSGCSGSGLAGITYTYDDVGNRLSEIRRSTSNTTTTSTYNDDDQLTQLGNHTYTYDDNGNQITKGSRSFTYDLENRLLANAQNNTHTYTYDGDGNRLTDTVGTAANDRQLLWDTNLSLPQLAIERDGNGDFQRSYTYGEGLLAESTNSTNAYYYLGDSIGSVANLIRHNGDVKWTYTYEPFGALRSETSGTSAPLNLMRFAGERIDQGDDLYNLRARMFDPSTGRFLQEDPVWSALLVPRTSNYVYAVDRPTVFVDPLGLCVIGLFGSDCDNPVHDFLNGVVTVGRGIYKGATGCIKGAAPVALVGAGFGAVLGFPEGGALVGGGIGCVGGIVYNLFSPPLSPPLPQFAMYDSYMIATSEK